MSKFSLHGQQDWLVIINGTVLDEHFCYVWWWDVVLRFLWQLGSVKNMVQYFKVLGNYMNLLSKKVMFHLHRCDYFSHRTDLKSMFVTAFFLEHPIERYLISFKKIDLKIFVVIQCY